MLRIALVGLFVLGLWSIGTSQTQTFRYTYDTGSQDQGKGVIALPNGSQVVSASAYLAATVTYDQHLIARNPNGTVQWVFQDRRAGESEQPIDLAYSRVGEIIALSKVWKSSGNVLRVARYSTAGAFLGETDIPAGMNTQHSARLALGRDGSIYVAGRRSNAYLAVKLAANGSVRWTWVSGLAGFTSTLTDIAVSADDCAIVGGYMENLGGYAFFKLDAKGTVVWGCKFFGNHGAQLGAAFVRPQPNGETLVACSPESSFGVPQWVVLKINAKGSIVWTCPYSASPNLNVECKAMATDAFGNTYLLAQAIPSATVLTAISPQGVQKWSYAASAVTPGDLFVHPTGQSVFCGRWSNTGNMRGISTSGVLTFSVTTQNQDRLTRMVPYMESSYFSTGMTFASSDNALMVNVFRAPWVSILGGP